MGRQVDAVEAWRRGDNVVVSAVPGAGKSRILTDVCSEIPVDQTVLLLCYNRNLCDETKTRLQALGLSERVHCYTFHGLCGHCIGPAHDDLMMHDAIESAQSDVGLARVLDVAHILIDEAQDFRPSFHRLLTLCLTRRRDAQYMLVCDKEQMLYTFDEEDAADLCYVTHPEMHFASSRPWARVTVSLSYRLSPSIAKVASHVKGVHIESAKGADCGAPPVDVHILNLYRTGELVLGLLRSVPSYADIALLVPFVRNSISLRVLLNFLTRAGIPIHVNNHTPTGEERVKENKLRVMTWHASKGMEVQTAVVWGVHEGCVDNALFVGMTRARTRTVVIIDAMRPHATLDAALASPALVGHVRRMTPHVRRTAGVVAVSSRVPPQLVALDDWRPSGSGRWCRAHVKVIGGEKPSLDREAVPPSFIVQLRNGTHEDTSCAFLLAVLMRAEHQLTGRIGLLEDVASPTRASRDQFRDAIAAGSQARIVNECARAEDLLPLSLVEAVSCYQRRQGDASPTMFSVAEWQLFARIALSWNQAHYAANQLRSIEWLSERELVAVTETIVECAREADDVWMDVRRTRVSASGRLFHIRVPLITRASSVGSTASSVAMDDASPHTDTAWLFTTDGVLTFQHALRVAVMACVATCDRGIVYSVTSRETLSVTIHDADAFFARLCNE